MYDVYSDVAKWEEYRERKMFEDTFDDYDMDRVLQTLQNEIESRKAAESELSKYRQWHEQAQIRAVDAEFELAQFMDDMIACLGLPDREYGDSVGEVIVAAVTKIIARAEAAEKRVAELEAERVETLENILQALGVDPNEIDEIYLEQTAIGCINALIARVAELEAKLAAVGDSGEE